ncbi:MAG: histidine phosphatase family protein [Deltaproteobacteria bacterium]|nr:histidine phosphatase family protein [Deltaproteobacteria bacterium]MBW2551485.1 histidine phosphatase family protein [Deltaproteobacteria bacterium]MBW2686281.1 histidine phosphatase family protein [Deltaproteobacteria bacterium]
MDLFLIRHAIAEKRRAGLPDAQRALTDKGRIRFAAMVQSFDQAGFRFDRVYHSPWLRALQTAELLTSINDGPLIPTEGLAQSPRPDFFASLTGETVACVGHEPWMSDTISLLTTGTPDGAWLHLKKGATAWLQGPPTPASMRLRALWGHSPPI